LRLGYLPKQRERGSWVPDGEVYTLQATMNEIGVVKIFHSFNGIPELKGALSVIKGWHVIVTDEFEVVASVIADVLCGVSVGHPVGDRREKPSRSQGCQEFRWGRPW